MPHPRGKATKALMTRLRIDWSAFKRASFEDRAIHGLTDGYTTELRSIVCNAARRGQSFGGGGRGGRRVAPPADLPRLLPNAFDDAAREVNAEG